MTTNLLTRLLGRQQQRRAEAAVTREDFIRQVLDERITDVDEILATCDRLGLTAEQLDQAVADLRETRRLQGVLADAPSLEKDERQLQKNNTEANERLQIAHKTHEAELERISAERERLNLVGRRAQIDDARQRLRLRETPASLTAEERQLVSSHTELNRERARLLTDTQQQHDSAQQPTSYGRLCQAKGRLVQFKKELGSCKTDEWQREKKQEVAAAEKHVEQLRKRWTEQRDALPALEKKIEDMNTKLATFYQKKAAQ